MYLKLYFSQAEMCQFLDSKGYSIVNVDTEVTENVYGNVFNTSVISVVTVCRNGKKLPLEEAFYNEIKAQLLTL